MDYDYQKRIDVLAECCKEVFEEMAATSVGELEAKRDTRETPDYALAHLIENEFIDEDVKGDFVLGFSAKSMAISVASAISENVGLGEVTELGEDAQETLNEFMNTVVGRALTGWDELGLPARFGPPRVLKSEEIQIFTEMQTQAYMIIMALDVGHIAFHVTFTTDIESSLRGKKVLVTDDSKIIRKLLRKTLEEVGLEVHTAENGRQAVEMFRYTSPDLTIMDVVMPEMGGIEATKAICEMDATAKVLMLTSTSRRDEIVAAKDAGAANYLLKPVKIPELMDSLRQALA